MKNIFLFFLLTTLPLLGFSTHGEKNKSTSKVVSGKVCDAYGEALPGTQIKIKETGESFFANFDGQFKLSLPSDKAYSLVIETIGFEPLELKSTELGFFAELSLKSL